MAGSDNRYRMLVLLEEESEEVIEKFEDNDNGEQPKQESTKSHEFIEELILPFETSELDTLNEWFDKFDEEICIPNEGNIKYEISSDGLVVLLIDKQIENVVEKVKEFVNNNQ
ncbi:hypothetical protein KAFR_0A02760 [Kazachstania africana CBS 2517]|uniref:Uncharacterized protein n=1 Tax=Kazachstania africana (strain ATCC 22294 / BCRC 22015 / CBS 2517 / CECT 1963 / NBRC 1671 / NRRL Y-8276) TaxID=1071382 RepID=H2AMW2_KAZAF|nr:hypothetical protein KAFR_0A02760 [Kazachstania africana CBS 2517]CCF55712.1 hypothetical protein KAFR_0A02760 [Kazachstania africana CBS 2517]